MTPIACMPCLACYCDCFVEVVWMCGLVSCPPPPPHRPQSPCAEFCCTRELNPRHHVAPTQPHRPPDMADVLVVCFTAAIESMRKLRKTAAAAPGATAAVV